MSGNILLFGTVWNFFLNIFNPWLFESVDMETVDIEGQLYSTESKQKLEMREVIRKQGWLDLKQVDQSAENVKSEAKSRIGDLIQKLKAIC